MSTEAFLAALDAQNATALSRIATAAARLAAARTLELAEELQEIARLKLGISRAPGC